MDVLLIAGIVILLIADVTALQRVVLVMKEGGIYLRESTPGLPAR